VVWAILFNFTEEVQDASRASGRRLRTPPRQR
jgi:hypothetical protein